MQNVTTLYEVMDKMRNIYFECGLLYSLRYFEEADIHHLSDIDIFQFAEHLASKKPWKTREEWYELIISNVARWKGEKAC
jgi:hypothetical protein